jgi:hypothetical protein
MVELSENKAITEISFEKSSEGVLKSILVC